MNTSVFKGSATAIITPMNMDGSISYKKMEELLEYQISHHTNAIVVAGTTGESACLSDEEHLRLIQFTCRIVNGRIPVIAGAGSNNTSHAQLLCKNAQNEELLEIPNVTAVKEASGNFSQLAKITSRYRDRLDIYCGNDDQAVSALALGAKGVISVLSNIEALLESLTSDINPVPALEKGTPGIFFGARSYNMQTPDGQIEESFSISAGLDFPSVGPEHAYLQEIGRAEYHGITDREALSAFIELSQREGIIPALESAHALKLARQNPEREQKFVVNLSGRGDKDIFQVSQRLEDEGLFVNGRLAADAAQAVLEG